MVSKSAVIGIDLGSAESYVAYVGKGIVDICQNEVSKRATSTLVGFTDRERLLGDAALAQIKSNAKNTCRNFKHLLGQNFDSPYVQAEHFWSTCKLVKMQDGHPGYEVHHKGETVVYSAVQATAMYLTKLKDVTEKWTQAQVADCVIGIPAYFSDVHRQAVLDAARIAGLSVLRLMNEHTATALAYGIYRSNEFDKEKPCTVAFCSAGLSIFSVSIVQFVKGRLEVICERSDKVGGRDMDECLMREFAEQFKKKHGLDPLTNKKSAFKLEDAVTKTKKILSANYEAGISCECLMEDEDFGSDIKRDTFLEMCKPMMAKVKAVLDAAKAAAGIPVAKIDFVEVVGGSSRVPWVKEMISKAFGGKAISTTMNADESVARGCALQAAILSPLYKVRDFEIREGLPIPVTIGWMGSSADSAASKGNDDGVRMSGAEGEFKTAEVFPASSPLNTLKILTFFRQGPFEIKAEHSDTSLLVPGTRRELASYRIDLPPQGKIVKVKVRATLTLSSMFIIEGAQIVEEEEYEEIVKEKREGNAATAAPVEAAGEAKTDGEAEAHKDPAKVEWVDVVKKKRRVKKTDIPVIASKAIGIPEAELRRLCDKETAMQMEMAEITETDEKRNDLESHIFNMRDKCADGGQYGAYIASGVRDAFMAELTKAEDWLYETQDTTKDKYVTKLAELKKTSDPVVWRHKESQIRKEWITALSGTITNYKAAATNPGEKYGHISADKLSQVARECDSMAAWLSQMQAKQESVPKYEKPILLCADMEKKNQELATFADDILKEPKTVEKKEAPEAGNEQPANEAGGGGGVGVD